MCAPPLPSHLSLYSGESSEESSPESEDVSVSPVPPGVSVPASGRWGRGGRVRSLGVSRRYDAVSPPSVAWPAGPPGGPPPSLRRR